MTENQNEWTFSAVEIERTPENGPGNYSIHGLPEGRNFRKVDSYTEIRAQYLSIDGHGFACSTCEIGEYQKFVTVKQETEGGAAKIELE